jgi:hypothetical protein
MDSQEVINVIIAVGMSVGGWFARQMWEAVQNLKTDINKLEVKLPTEYVSKQEFNDRWIEVLSALRRIEDKIDTKVDKNQ